MEKIIIPPRHHRAEMESIEMALNETQSRMIGNHMEEQNRETEEERLRREELQRVTNKKNPNYATKTTRQTTKEPVEAHKKRQLTKNS